MGPKVFSIFDMDATSKGLSWIDGMYQKFEAMCMEVDENPSLLLQETTKYVENKFSVIGANVRKFCAEVIQDILPPVSEEAIKNLGSNMSVNFGEGFELSEKLNPDMLHPLNVEVESLPHHEFKQSFTYFGEDLDNAVVFPHELQKENPLLYWEELCEYENLAQLPSISLKDMSLSEDSVLKKKTKWHSESQMKANVCNTIPHGADLTQETTCIDTIAEDTKGKQKGSTEKTGTEIEPDNQKNEDICGVGGMQVNDHLFPRNGISEIMALSVEHYGEETGDSEENIEGHEEDGEKTSAVVESLNADHSCVSEEESVYEVLDVQEDDNDESAYWYGNEDVEKHNMVDVPMSNSLSDIDVEKWQLIEKCDLDWELL